MLLPEKEKRLLKDLIGRKVDAIYIPSNRASLPAVAYLMLGNHQILKIDSCRREQHAVETMKQYPQLRLELINEIPNFYRMDQILEGSGDIIQSVRIISEQIQTNKDYVIFTCGFSFHFMGHHYVTIVRESCNTPGLKVSLTTRQDDSLIRDDRYIHHILDDL